MRYHAQFFWPFRFAVQSVNGSNPFMDGKTPKIGQFQGVSRPFAAYRAFCCPNNGFFKNLIWTRLMQEMFGQERGGSVLKGEAIW
jgi:hypothetical protein